MGLFIHAAAYSEHVASFEAGPYAMTMIQRFYVHNFRCLENFELPIGGMSSSLLIGKNGTGKSTIGLALKLMQRIGRGSNRVGELLRPKDFTCGRLEVPIRFEIEAKLGEVQLSYQLALELPAGFRELRVREEKLAVDDEEIYSRDRAQVTLAKASGGEAKFLVDWHLVALPLIQFPLNQASIESFKLWLARMLILSPIPSRISGNSSGDTLEPDSEVSNFAEWWTGLLALSPSSYGRIDNHLKLLMPDLREIKNPPVARDARALSVLFQQDDAVLTLPFDELSDGEKCFFVGATVVAANEAYGPLFCFWDEPDNFLSLTELGDFVMDLRRSFRGRGQLVATTHNEHAMNQFPREDIFYLQRRSHLEPTVVKSLKDVEGDIGEQMIDDEVPI